MKNVFLKLEEHANDYDSVEDFVSEQFGGRYGRQEMGQAVTDLLNYFADGQHDYIVADLLADLITEYINDRI